MIFGCGASACCTSISRLILCVASRLILARLRATRLPSDRPSAPKTFAKLPSPRGWRSSLYRSCALTLAAIDATTKKSTDYKMTQGADTALDCATVRAVGERFTGSAHKRTPVRCCPDCAAEGRKGLLVRACVGLGQVVEHSGGQRVLLGRRTHPRGGRCVRRCCHALPVGLFRVRVGLGGEGWNSRSYVVPAAVGSPSASARCAA